MKTWEKIAAAAGVIGTTYLGGHLIHHLDKLQAIDDMMRELPEGASVLNIGCKNWSIFGGKLSYFKTTNIDIEPRNVPNFVLADARDLGMFADDTFQGRLASHVLEHIPKEDIPKVISELRRVCSDPNHIYIVLPRWFIPVSWLCRDHYWVPVGDTMVPNPLKA
jgi:SAM-dependent methyltransferase